MTAPRPRIGPRLTLSLVRAMQRRLEASRRDAAPGEEGVSIVLVLLVVLILLIGTATLASRSFLGFVGSVFQGQGREAASAAELGANWAISQLNKEQNRTMLVTGDATNEAVAVPPQVAWPGGSIPGNLCGITSTPNTGSAALDPDPSTPEYEPWYVLPNGTITATEPAGGNYRSFRIIGVRRPSLRGNQSLASDQSFGLRIYRDRDFANLASSGTQPFFLQVEGASFRNGVRVANTTLEQEFEVAPKCCGRTFGGEHGNDLYDESNRLEDEVAVCVPESALGYGLVAGAGPGDGEVDLKGTPNFTTDQEQDIDPIFCLVDQAAEDPSSCSINVTGGVSTSVELVDASLPLPADYSLATGVNPAPAATNLENCSKTSCPSNLDSAVFNDDTFTTYATADVLNTEGDVVISKGDTIVNASTVIEANLPPNCALTSTAGTNPIETIHCNVNQLSPSDNIIFRTSVNRRIALYFPNADPGKGSDKYIVETKGNAGLLNLRCDPSDPTNCTFPTLSDDPPYPITTLGIYGCREDGCGPQTVYLRGTPSTLFSFIHLPYGTLDFGGTSDFAGVAWVENLNANGTPTFTIPGSGIGDVLCQIGAIECDANPNPPNANPPFFDWVARATNRFRWLGN